MYKKYKKKKKIKHKMIQSVDIGEVTEKECAVCYGNKPNIQIIPCEHNQFCSECIKCVRECPMCRGVIKSVKILPGSVQVCEDDSDEENEEENNIRDDEHNRMDDINFIANMV